MIKSYGPHDNCKQTGSAWRRSILCLSTSVSIFDRDWLTLPGDLCHQLVSMNSNERTNLSRTLSKILRHKATDEGLTIQSDGYISLQALLARPKLQKLKANLEKVQQVVAEDNKTRFTLRQDADDVWWIRANQGHSLIVDNLELERITDPSKYPVVLHGTYLPAWNKIKHEGLRRMTRNHIHLATGKFGEAKSGVRRNCEVFIYIDLGRAMAAGIEFYVSSNGVILTPGNEDGRLPQDYFLRAERDDGTVLFDSKGTASDGVKSTPTTAAQDDAELNGVAERTRHLTIAVPLARRGLFGNTIETLLPQSWLDASDFRQVPDNQEVFLHPDRQEVSLIVELIDTSDLPVDAKESGLTHFRLLAEDNDAVHHAIASCTLESESGSTTAAVAGGGASDAPRVLVCGTQTVAKFNTSTQQEITVVLGLVRLTRASTDVLITYNAPDTDHRTQKSTAAEEGTEIVRSALRSLTVLDWTLFPECC